MGLAAVLAIPCTLWECLMVFVRWGRPLGRSPVAGVARESGATVGELGVFFPFCSLCVPVYSFPNAECILCRSLFPQPAARLGSKTTASEVIRAFSTSLVGRNVLITGRSGSKRCSKRCRPKACLAPRAWRELRELASCHGISA